MIGGRTLLQVLGIYAAGSWLVMQVVDVLKENMGLPDWVFPFALVLLLIGLPIILTTAVVQKRIATAGVEPTSKARDPGFPAEQAPARPLDGPSQEVRRFFTWKNALVGGAAAFVLLAVVTGGFMFMRNRGIGPVGSLVASGLLEEKAAILVADFAGDDPSLARAATQAFRVDLSQSELVRVVEPATLDGALRRMQLPEDQPLTQDVAHELAVREGYPAVIEGEIASVGDGYVITARLADAQSEETLASIRETAADANGVIPAIDRLSGKMRERIGDSYTNMRADEPLERVTTGSLDALEKYSRALDLFESGRDYELGIALLEEAVAADSGFAMAWRKLGVELVGDQARRVEAIEKAYEHRERLTERERLLAEAQYYYEVVDDPRKAIGVFERLVDLDPSDSWALNNLGASHTQLGQWAEAEHWFDRSVAVDSTIKSITNLAQAQLQQGRFDAADSTLDAGERIAPGHERTSLVRSAVAANRGDWDAAMTYARRLRDESPDASWSSMGGLQMGNVAAVRGRFAEADRLWQESTEKARLAEFPFASGALMQRFDIDLDVRGDTARAIRTLDAIRAAEPFEAMDPLNRPYLWFSTWYARAGAREKSEAMRRAYEAEVPVAYRVGRTVEANYEATEGFLLLSEGRPAEALEAFRRADPGDCGLCGRIEPAKAFEALGQPDSAIASYESYLETGDMQRAAWDNDNLGPTLERLAALYDEKGDPDAAALYYARLVELWSDADAELQPRVAAARARLEEILKERG
jgi:tetratricopeptide (TPR) repeat protein